MEILPSATRSRYMAPNAMSQPSQPSSAGRASGKQAVPFKPDLTKPLVFQVGYLGEHYDDWVHQPIISRTGPRLFGPDWMEFFTQTHWWMIPLVWLPVIAFAEYRAALAGTPKVLVAPFFALGLVVWTLMEYSLHRFLFHYRTTGYWTNTLHYLLHGCHHKHPQDRFRLVMPPVLFATLSTVVAIPFFVVFPGFLVWPVYAGAIFGYICYDMTHYFVHFGVPLELEWIRFLRRYHMAHHFKVYNAGFGITNSFWDKVFGTYPADDPKKADAASKADAAGKAM
ncbi:unnamed protein product [Closterium sp. NIES-65]|nr:unnamed protein product [Closterium sp. NIES-65]